MEEGKDLGDVEGQGQEGADPKGVGDLDPEGVGKDNS